VRPSLKFWSVVLAIAALTGLAVVWITPTRRSICDGGYSFPGYDIAAFKVALDTFQEDTGHYPEGKAGLSQLLWQPAGETNWHGPYLDKLPKDPWGHDYAYECPGKHNSNSFDLFSLGPDGRAGTDDDIVNWKK
jgi:general secretion pathway protein G